MRISQENTDLVQRGLVDKLNCLYLLTPPQGIAEKVELASLFLKRKMEEYYVLKVEIEAQRAEVGEDQGQCNKV